MSENNLSAEETNIFNYLSKNKFLIPMYQRNYTWKENECGELWDDITGFFEEEQDKKYFLGSIVLYKDDEGVQNIIDGQQRTTTLILLLCALYDKAFKQQGGGTQNLLQKLECCLWDTDEYGSGKPYYDKFHLKSEVALEEDNEILHCILQRKYKLPENDKQIEKIRKDKKTSKYEKNYLFFIEKSNDFARDFPDDWNNLCVNILTRCVLLPIKCGGAGKDERFENALRIFNTLNNRGISLSDADIFKGEIIKSRKNKEEEKIFIEQWKELEKMGREKNKDNYENFLFAQYMHYIRAKKNDKSQVIHLRKFFINKHKDILIEPKTMQDIISLSDFWTSNFNDFSLKSQQFFSVLRLFPNEYWKYLISVCYLYFKEKEMNFIERSDEILAKIVANLLVKFIDKPTINAIKPLIFNAYISLYEKNELDFRSNSRQILENENSFKDSFDKLSNQTMKSLLALNSFLKYPEEKPIKAEIEHIHPQTTKWRKNYTAWENKEEAKQYIEMIGNKIWLEKRLNIVASNDYFDNKKEKYKHSQFLEARDLALYPKDDWLKEDIVKRSDEIYQRLFNFFKENI